MSSGTCINCTGETCMESTRSRTTRISHFQTPEYVPGQQETLLTLPAEIRARIWSFVYNVEPTYWSKVCKTCGSIPCQSLRVEIQHAPYKAATTSVLASLRTCRLIHDEAAHLFYSLNLLSLSSPAALYHFLSTLSPRLRQSITALHVANVSRCNWSTASIAPQAFSLLSLCPRLREFFVDFSIDEDADGDIQRALIAEFHAQRLLLEHSEIWDNPLNSPVCQAFSALSKQRNFVRLGIRGRHSSTASSSNVFKQVETARPYSYEDAIFQDLQGDFVDMLRAKVQQRGLRPSTRYERARSAQQGP